MRSNAALWRTGFWASLILLGIILPAAAIDRHRPAASERWTTYKNDRFGYSLYYPSGLFTPEPPPANGSGLTLSTGDGRAQIVVFGVHNTEHLSPKEYRRVLVEEFGGYDRLDYNPIGKTWFVLSGFRHGNIYYQKVMFTCSNRIINVFSMTFPTDEKPFYEPLIETMEDKFRPGRGVDTPERC